MPERKRYEPEKITAALKLLRALPVKDNRKTLNETLLTLKGGILDALDKGYDRTEIRQTIATAEVVISATSFNDFLAVNLNGGSLENGTGTAARRKKGEKETPTEQEATGNAMPAKTEIREC